MSIKALREKAARLPLKPGVYIMSDENGTVIYVGKAKKLQNRVSSYFHGAHNAKTEAMVSHVADFNVIIAESEFEALVLESQLIKHHMPKYNILLKDDKGYPYLRVDQRLSYPSMEVVGKPSNDGAHYSGPFGSRSVIFSALSALQKALRLPSCSKRFPAELGKSRPCLNQAMGLCEGWCTGTPNSEEFRRRIDAALLIFDGKSDELSRQLRQEMEASAEALEFEKAAKLRDRLRSVESLARKQIAVSGSAADTDAIGFFRGASKYCFAVLHYIGGKLLDKDYSIAELSAEEDSEALSLLLRQYYLSRNVCPSLVLLPFTPDDCEDLSRLFTEQFGRKISVQLPLRGDKKLRVETAMINARQEIERISNREDRISGILKWLQNAAALPALPRRVEAYDVSNFGNEGIVSSMTVFTDTKPLKRDYRRFRMNTVTGADDYGSMRETLMRRFSEYAAGNEKFSVLPDLLLIDGGSVHAGVAEAVLREFSLQIPVLGMVKDGKHRTRALVCSDGREIGLEGNPAAFAFIGRVQEETHRFTIEYQRNLRRDKLTSRLDGIEGIGTARKNALLTQFHSLKGIQTATLEELAAVIPKKAANTLYTHLHGAEPPIAEEEAT